MEEKRCNRDCKSRLGIERGKKRAQHVHASCDEEYQHEQRVLCAMNGELAWLICGWRRKEELLVPEVDGEEGDDCETASWQRRWESCGQGRNSGKSPNTSASPYQVASICLQPDTSNATGALLWMIYSSEFPTRYAFFSLPTMIY